MDKPLIVIVYHKIPLPYTNGTNQRLKALVEFLRHFYRVGLVVPVWRQDLNELSNTYDFVWFGAHHDNLADKFYWHVSGWLKSSWLKIEFKLSRRKLGNPLLRFHVHAAWKLKQICHEHSPNLIIVEKIINTVPVVQIAKKFNVPTVLDVHDLYAVAESGITASNKSRFPGIVEAHELDLLRQYDALIAIQHADANRLRKLLPEKPTILAMHPVKVRADSISSKRNRRLLFVGSSSQHNVHAISYFVENVLARVAEVYEDIELEVCGTVTSALRFYLPNVVLTGVVNDLSPHYAQASIVINPVLFGSGLKIKTVEALAYGKCLVTTPIGAEGLVDVENSAVIVQPKEMYQAIINLLESSEEVRRYERSAQEYAETHFTPESCYTDLLNHIGAVIERQHNA